MSIDTSHSALSPPDHERPRSRHKGQEQNAESTVSSSRHSTPPARDRGTTGTGDGSYSVSSDLSSDSRGDSKVDIMFEECHWYDIPCPHPKCYEKGLRFDDHDKFKLHHEQEHCPRGENGDIHRGKNSSRWQCPVMILKTVDGHDVREKCGKISNSWYNYAGHITSHREIGHGWGCALEPQGKRKKTNCTRNGKIVCGKRTSTKHHLLAHMNNVHKRYNVIDQSGRQYNRQKKLDRAVNDALDREKRKRQKSNDFHSTSTSTKSQSSHSQIGRKRSFQESVNENQVNVHPQIMYLDPNGIRNHNHNHNALPSRPLPPPHQSLLQMPPQMPLPQFPPISQSIPLMSFPPSMTPSVSTPYYRSATAPEIPFVLSQVHPPLPFNGDPLPLRKRLRLNPDGDNHPETPSKALLIPSSQGKQCDAEEDQFQFLTLLCKAADSHRCSDCNQCNANANTTPNGNGNGDIDEVDSQDMEGSIPSLPSLSTHNSSKTPCFTSPSTVSDQTVLTNPNSNSTLSSSSNSAHKVPQLPVFPNFTSTQSLHRTVNPSNSAFAFNVNPFSGTTVGTTSATPRPLPVSSQHLLALSTARQKGQDLAQKQFASLLQGNGALSMQNGVMSSSMTSQVTFPPQPRLEN